MKERFRKLAQLASRAMGTSWAFFVALATVLVWAISGPFFHFSDTWQLVINTGTTVVTFLMVFLIQNTQNRDSREIHLKLDELLRAIAKARTGLADVGDLSDQELDRLLQEFHQARERKGLEQLAPEPAAASPDQE